MYTEGFTLLNWGHVAAAQKRSHYGAQPWLQTILKQLKEWNVIVFCDQSGETLQVAPTQQFLFTQPYPFPQENLHLTVNYLYSQY